MISEQAVSTTKQLLGGGRGGVYPLPHQPLIIFCADSMLVVEHPAESAKTVRLAGDHYSSISE
ncbi:hypothetical protein AmaxDRAFT_0261 [Limnospira maxima CS-328]|uniref:Uncharacterized protein n=1 Tax=Limnospira maxima CS-328 TaxID=513049 RepID=B5VUL6_LIMMA|nr:hypothetical protein AmaxDRAFT_0261 [Limnospira maxima CS-328]UWU51038.1 hypothetical protein APLC1_5996 [Arthrospira platensis C1]